MHALASAVEAVARTTGFSGVVRVDRPEAPSYEAAFGLADRRHEIPMRVGSQLGIASGTKALTATAVMSLAGDGLLDLHARVRQFLGDRLPMIGDDVTIEHLLSHRSGIGDHIDEDENPDLNAYLLTVPAHELVSTSDCLRLLDGLPPKFPAGTRFSYCNAGYVLLAHVVEQVVGTSFAGAVRERVCGPAGMADTEFLRSDELPGRAATGYLSVDGRWRTNVFHLPVVGSGDGGVYTTVGDVHRFWSAFFGGRIVAAHLVETMVRRRNDPPGGVAEFGYGLGFWLGAGDRVVTLEGADAGVSFRSTHARSNGLTWTVIGNTSDGAWPVADAVGRAVADIAPA